MRVAITGATGFLGRYLVGEFVGQGCDCRCWHRPSSDRTGFEEQADRIEWVPGELGDDAAGKKLVKGCDAVVHAGLHRGSGDVAEYAEKNIVGTLRLIEAARSAGVERFVFIASCAVHERILDDRTLDEKHPLWPCSHYGAYKAAVEKFVHSYGMGEGYGICSLRPVGIYGVARPVANSRWYGLVQSVARNEAVHCEQGGKEVHAADVARAAAVLVSADGIAGEAYNCFDIYVSDWDVAHIAKEISGSDATIEGKQTRPKHIISTEKLRALGMRFGGRSLLEETIGEMIKA